MNTRICNDCGKERSFIRTDLKHSSGGWVYVDAEGHRWSGRRCIECKRKHLILSHRKLGLSKPIDQSTHKGHVISRKAEHAVAKWFREQGYHVVITAGKGPDLVVTREDGWTFTVEVKAATLNGRSKRSWRVSPVLPTRQGDTFIAVYLPDGRVHIEIMEVYLKRGASKWRTVTELVNGQFR